MFKHIKKIIPSFISLLIFGTGFVYLNLTKNDTIEPEIQMSPGNFLYHEKFGNVYEYLSADITTKGEVTNVRINNKPGVSEPVIKINPMNRNKLVVSSNDFTIENNKARIFLSENGGADWRAEEINLSNLYEISSYSDPWIEFDQLGNLYYTCIQYDLHRIKKDGVLFSKSTDGGETWEPDSKILSENVTTKIKNDNPKIFIDNKSIIYLYWTEVSGFNSFIKLSVSKDNGNTFTSPITAAGEKAHFGIVTKDNSGNVYLTYLNADENIGILKTTDEGHSWNDTGYDLKFPVSGNSAGNNMHIKTDVNQGFRINSGPSVTLTVNNDLLISFSARSKGKDISDIYFTSTSLDNFENKLPVRVNNDQSFNDQYHPVINVDFENNIYVFYQDSRNDHNNVYSESYISVSTDGGISFDDHNISTAQYSPSDIAVNHYFGDYNSFVLSENFLIAAWTDGRNGNYDIYSGIIDLDYLFTRK